MTKKPLLKYILTLEMQELNDNLRNKQFFKVNR